MFQFEMPNIRDRAIHGLGRYRLLGNTKSIRQPGFIAPPDKGLDFQNLSQSQFIHTCEVKYV